MQLICCVFIFSYIHSPFSSRVAKCWWQKLTLHSISRIFFIEKPSALKSWPSKWSNGEWLCKNLASVFCFLFKLTTIVPRLYCPPPPPLLTPFKPTDHNNNHFSAFPMRLWNGALDSKFTHSTVVHLTRWKTNHPISLNLCIIPPHNIPATAILFLLFTFISTRYF